MPSANYLILRKAIMEKLQITCSYQGNYRVLCPHVLGTRGGVERVLCYLVGGGRASGLPSLGAWHCMVVSSMNNITTRMGSWHTGYPRPRCVDQVDVEM